MGLLHSPPSCFQPARALPLPRLPAGVAAWLHRCAAGQEGQRSDRRCGCSMQTVPTGCWTRQLLTGGAAAERSSRPCCCHWRLHCCCRAAGRPDQLHHIHCSLLVLHPQVRACCCWHGPPPPSCTSSCPSCTGLPEGRRGWAAGRACRSSWHPLQAVVLTSCGHSNPCQSEGASVSVSVAKPTQRTCGLRVGWPFFAGNTVAVTCTSTCQAG